MSGCEKPSLEAEGPTKANAPVARQNATADLKAVGSGKNPFTVENMQQAYTNLLPPIDCLDCGPVTPPPPPPVVQPTHLYVRFKPANTDQLADLDGLGYQLSWEPMDESVAAVTTVDYQSDAIPWLYTVVPVGTVLPSYIQREQLAQLFLFYPEDGDAREDPWVPYPDPVPPTCPPAWDPSCRCYVKCAITNSVATIENRITGKPNKQAEATKKLKEGKVSPRALYNEAMRISGNAEEALSESSTSPSAPKAQGIQAQATAATRYHPSGRILVQDTDLGNVPLRGVAVKSRRWFQFGSAFTDNLGNFNISTSYKNKAKISLQFKNNLATTRGIIGGVRVWQAVLPINSDLGTYAGPAMQGLAYTITFQGGLDKLKSKGASTWAAATLFNTLADTQSFAAARGLPGPPQGINVWLLPDFPPASGPGATPMLRKIASTSAVSQVIDFLLLGSGLSELLLIKQILQRQLPDVLIRYGGDQGLLASHQLNPLLYHELGHTQHYSQVGNDFWTAYIAYVVRQLGYGEKTGYEAGRIAISEGWGYYTQRLYMINKYQASSYPARATIARDELDNQVPSDYGSGWLIYGMYHDMTDSTPEPVPGVVDNVTAYTPATVFRGLQQDVATVRQYQTKVQYLNNGLQAPQLEQLVTSYRW